MSCGEAACCCSRAGDSWSSVASCSSSVSSFRSVKPSCTVVVLIAELGIIVPDGICADVGVVVVRVAVEEFRLEAPLRLLLLLAPSLLLCLVCFCDDVNADAESVFFKI